MQPLVVYSGALAQVPHHGGLAWFHLQFLLGFRRLGWDVLFLDRLWPEVCGGVPPKESANLRYAHGVMADYGLADRYAVLGPDGATLAGMPRTLVLERVAAAELLLNVMGYLDDEEILTRARRPVFVDIDPGFPQMWRELGLHDAFAGHTDFVTLGRNIGRPGCDIPTCGLRWLTMPQPVVLERWPARSPQPNGAFTSIGAWRGPNGPVQYNGRIYGLRAHEFRTFVRLPARCPAERFELALGIHTGDAKDRQLLGECGWSIAEPEVAAGSPPDYQEYVARSKAEFCVPKQMYVATNSGLLSDRSAYYLATGRPVLARDTGLAGLYPAGEGLLTFATLDDAAAGVKAISRQYARHCRAARAIAEEFFESGKVLTRLLLDLGVR